MPRESLNTRVLRGPGSQERVSAFKAVPIITDGPDADPVAARQAEGHARGLEEGRRDAAREVDALRLRLGQTLEEMAATARERVQRHEQDLVRLALAMASRLLRREIAADGELAQRTLQEALAALPDAGPLKVRVHPGEAEALQVLAPKLSGDSQVTIIADPSIEPGGLVVSDGDAEVDARIEAQITALAAALDVPPPGGEPQK